MAYPLEGFVFAGGEPVALPPMLIKRLIPYSGIAFIGGQYQAGKSFIAVHMAACLASSAPFFGHKVRERVGVAIFAAESEATMSNRIAAGLPIAWLSAVPNLSDPAEVDKIIPQLKALAEKFHGDHHVRLGAVILDTLAATCIRANRFQPLASTRAKPTSSGHMIRIAITAAVLD